MNRNKHLLLWSSLGVLILLIAAAVQENFLKDWRRIQAAAANEAGPLPVHLRQVVVAELGVADRCVSCHVGMAPGEQGVVGGRVAAAHPPLPHDPGDFGCTVCHGGQGRATERADAHGEALFWPQPMIPLQFASAGCGTCHTPLQVPNESQLARGQRLVERYDCLACHRIDGRGGTLRPGGVGGMEGPDLSQAGAAGYDSRWYEKHLQQAEAAADGPWKTSFGTIDQPARRAIEDYLTTRVGAPQLVAARSLMHSLGCLGCHKIGGVGGDDGPDLTHAGDKDPGQLDFTHVAGSRTLSNWTAEHFRNPPRVVPGSQMPVLGLSEEQIEQLTLATFSLRRGRMAAPLWPRDRLQTERFGAREFAQDGANLFSTFCVACHGQAGEGLRYPGHPPAPAIGNPDFLAAATDDFLASTIGQGRPGRRMPAWNRSAGGLRDEEIAELIGHLRRLGGVESPQPQHPQRRWVTGDVALGEARYAISCAGCHGTAGQGTDAPALNNPGLLAAASDEYLVETISRGRRGTVMPGFESGSPVYPALSASEIESIVAFLRTWEKP